jgi:hypothetical protein
VFRPVSQAWGESQHVIAMGRYLVYGVGKKVRGKNGLELAYAVGGEAHEAVEESPCGAEDLGWWAVRGLLECHVGFLGFFR